jgi:hypothetical protein
VQVLLSKYMWLEESDGSLRDHGREPCWDL